jgi:hypothetical protein
LLFSILHKAEQILNISHLQILEQSTINYFQTFMLCITISYVFGNSSVELNITLIQSSSAVLAHVNNLVFNLVNNRSNKISPVQLTQWNTVHLGKLTATWLTKKFLPFTEPEVSLPCSQEPATVSYPKSDGSFKIYLILSYHLYVDLPRNIITSRFPLGFIFLIHPHAMPLSPTTLNSMEQSPS